MDADVPAGHEQLISQFVAITDVDSSRAKFYLESSAWNLEIAIASFYEQGDPDPDGDPVVDISDDVSDSEADHDVPATDEFVSPHASGGSRFATLSSIKDSSKTSKGKDERQAYYAGGSETSGQQILGPPKEKNIVDSLFKSAKEHGAEPPEESSGPSESHGMHRGSRFTGAGYRLGDTEDDSEMIQGALVPQQPKQVDVVLKLFKEGFSVDDGELRDYQEPANKDFLNSVFKGEIPKELLRNSKGMDIKLDMENHRNEDYVKPKQSLRAFSGAGHMLGSPAPTVVSHTAGAAAAGEPSIPGSLTASSPSPVIDNTQPVTNIQIRLADGSKLVAKFNHRHQVRDIRNHIISSRPEYANQTFILMTTFPNKELSDDSITLEEAKLLNAVIVQRMK